MTQENVTAKRCETCGRLGACPSMRADQLIDLRATKMENTPGYCGKWVDKQIVIFDRVPNPNGDGSFVARARGNEEDGQQPVTSTAPIPGEGVSAPSDAAALRHLPQEGGSEVPSVVHAKADIDFKALDKVIDIGKSRELAKIEVRIDIAKQQTMGALLEIGRCLNEAKDRNLVPHGQWEQWAAEQTGMGERTRQRIMQAAREIPAGSYMEKLDFSKAVALLALPDGDREAVAEKAVAENTPLRKLQDQVNELTGKLTKTAKDAQLQKEIDKRTIDTKDKKIQELAAQAIGAEQAKLELHRSSLALAAQTAATKQALERVQELENGVQPADVSSPAVPAQGISPEAQAIIDRLNAEKEQAEQYAEEQANLRQQAQADLLHMRSQAAHSDGNANEAFTLETLRTAVRGFLGEAGVLPMMGKHLAALSAAERAAYQSSVNLMAGWVDGSRRALDMVAGEGSIMEA